MTVTNDAEVNELGEEHPIPLLAVNNALSPTALRDEVFRAVDAYRDGDKRADEISRLITGWPML